MTIFYLSALSEQQHKMRPCLARVLNSEFYFVCASLRCAAFKCINVRVRAQGMYATVTVPHATAKIYSSFTSIENKLSFPTIDLLILFSSILVLFSSRFTFCVFRYATLRYATLRCAVLCLPDIISGFICYFANTNDVSLFVTISMESSIVFCRPQCSVRTDARFIDWHIYWRINSTCVHCIRYGVGIKIAQHGTVASTTSSSAKRFTIW